MPGADLAALFRGGVADGVSGRSAFLQVRARPGFFSSFIFVAALLVISFVDLDVRIVPDVISLPGIVLACCFPLLGYYVVH